MLNYQRLIIFISFNVWNKSTLLHVGLSVPNISWSFKIPYFVRILPLKWLPSGTLNQWDVAIVQWENHQNHWRLSSKPCLISIATNTGWWCNNHLEK
jgi:hypothetical protein